ncbi:ubiquinone biosynthesis hydroxylase [Bartonella tamiae]|uniref:UbiH/UbiF/VisC/COQ6 family ubiquinone biosynthesis hydroxylase n=1 Tax=Bartonella tamiae Th239 TaxID=1094558 RepID=J1K231_9HYPH|nr:ubiquinone biosynthesis hydroxylase [Bartonella tamiae]EJF91507.1 UbiH/UbiF/VisC/COQ6 family ubiquinone biosynthesis hydroxylase [Bartonella tamiae Th239]EJF92509.1 UbiH/UbiF/VisC/COQ6 family ubiquinone biosynthesis hydroxylase [Bartonella tamiae Th307]
MSKSKQTAPLIYDVVITGGAHVGLTLAVAIKQAAPFLNIAVIDANPHNSWKNDLRASAIAAAAIRMLNTLNCWQEVEPLSQPITEMIITDSEKSDPVRPVFLTFDGDLSAGEPFAYMVENKYLNQALHKRAEELNLSIMAALRVENFQNEHEKVIIHLSNGQNIITRLLVAADGVRSQLRDIAGIKTVHWPYHQKGIVCTVEHERDHHGRAEEHFLAAGPFAILPLKGKRSSLVWNERNEEADRLISADKMVFEAELETRFGHHLGALKLVSERRAFPFGLTLAREFVKPRFALAGDAAHGIHPISGQGLNLGFRDAAALSEIIVDTARLGLDIGSLASLERYQTWRRFETVRMGMTTDILNRMFSNDIAPLRAFRDIGLGLVDRMPKLKNYFISEAAGLTNGSPKLLMGENL